MTPAKSVESFSVRSIGVVNSKLKDLKDCPLQGSEGAPEAYLELHASYAEGTKDICVGDKLVVLTWFHLASREILSCYKRNNVGSQEFGVFSTRSPGRPNPIGLHTVTVLEVVNAQKIKIFPMEALHGTPIIDIKPFV